MDNHPESFPDHSIENRPELREQAEKLSQKWEEILNGFSLPCPICSGEIEMLGVSPSRLYEFAEGEPGTITLIDHRQTGTWVNAGSAGRPCDGDPRATVAVLEKYAEGWRSFHSSGAFRS